MLALLGQKSSILSPSVLISSGSLKQPVMHPARVLILSSGTYFQDLTLWFLLRTLCRRAALQRGGMYFAFTEKSPWKKQMGNVAAGKLGRLHGESLKKKKKAYFLRWLNYGILKKVNCQNKQQNTFKHISRNFSENSCDWCSISFPHPLSSSRHATYFLIVILYWYCWTLEKV